MGLCHAIRSWHSSHRGVLLHAANAPFVCWQATAMHWLGNCVVYAAHYQRGSSAVVSSDASMNEAMMHKSPFVALGTMLLSHLKLGADADWVQYATFSALHSIIWQCVSSPCNQQLQVTSMGVPSVSVPFSRIGHIVWYQSYQSRQLW